MSYNNNTLPIALVYRDFTAIHDFRHTNASLLLSEGEDIENISAHLGHASVETTSKVYAHMYAEVRVRMAKTVSNELHNK